MVGNVIARNRFVLNTDHPFKNLGPDDKLYGIQFRDEGGGHVHDNSYLNNTVDIKLPQGSLWSLPADIRLGVEVKNDGPTPEYTGPSYEALGSKKPVGARPLLRGRGKIIMTEWGPWDHKGTMVRTRSKTGSEHVYEVYGGDPIIDHHIKIPGISVAMAEGVEGVPLTIRIQGEPGVHSYRIPMQLATRHEVLEGVIVGAEWTLTAFPWDEAADPRTNLEAWRALAKGDKAVTTKVTSLRFPYAGGGPRDQASLPRQFRDKAPGSNHFGTVATTTFTLPKGKWTFRTTSDDGVRVSVNGRRSSRTGIGMVPNRMRPTSSRNRTAR